MNGNRYTYVVGGAGRGRERNEPRKGVATPSAPLLSPRAAAARSKGGTTLRWRAVPHATVLQRATLAPWGRKVLTSWPAGPSAPPRHDFARARTLWLVWPGLGPRASSTQYGPLIGRSTFVVKG